jgi:hypothetical protein
MPPEHEGEPFTAVQVKLLSDWIAAGALAPPDEKAEADPKDHWAFRECVRPPVPFVANTNWVKPPFDISVRRFFFNELRHLFECEQRDFWQILRAHGFFNHRVLRKRSDLK